MDRRDRRRTTAPGRRVRRPPPPQDLEVELIPRTTGALAAVVAFTGRIVIAGDVAPDWVGSRCPPGNLVAPIRPEFLAALTERCGCTAFSTTVTLALPSGIDRDREVIVVPADDRVTERIH